MERQGGSTDLATRWPDPAGSAADQAGIVNLSVSIAGRIDVGRVPAAFGEAAQAWLGEPAGTNGDGLAQYACDLELRVGPEQRAAFRKSALVALGPPEPTADGWTIPIEWRAASLAPLFPVLVGRLRVTPERLTIDGSYAPPFGAVGHLLDHGLRIAAGGTAHWFLARVAEVLADR